MMVLSAPAPLLGQSGPWASSSGKLKGEALIRESDGGYLAEVQSIVQGGGDVNWQMMDSGLTPLMAAASSGKLDVVQFLLAQGADPSLKDARGRTALDRAREAGANDVYQALQAFAAGAPQPTAGGAAGREPTGPWARYDGKMKGEALIRDSDGGYLAEVRSIVEGGGDVNWQMMDSGLTPLMAAASGGHAEIVAFLLGQGADPSLRDSRGMTALDRAVQAGASDVVRLLRTEAAPAPQGGRRAGGNAPASAPAPAAAPTPAPAPAASAATGIAGNQTSPVSTAPAARWAPFPTYQIGDRVRFYVPGGWRTGTVTEVGPAGDYSANTASTYERKYRIADDRFGGSGDWYDWGWVAGTEREPFWTGFFIGDWAVGEGMSWNTRVEGSQQRDEYLYVGATEAIRVNASGTYSWKLTDGKVVDGSWAQAEDGPGIVLRRGAQGRDWTLRNETNAIEENIRSIQTVRLYSEGSMSIAGKRPIPGQ